MELLKYWLMLASPACMFLLLFLFINKRNKNINPELMARKKAGKQLEKKLEIAAEALNENHIDKFYQLLYSAWLDYLSVKI